MFLFFFQGEDEDEDDMFDDFSTRSFFPASWMWMDEVLPHCKSKEKWSAGKSYNLVVTKIK